MLASLSLHKTAASSKRKENEMLEVVSTSSDDSNYLKEYVEEPGALDICCGRGKGFFNHPGNKLFQDSVREYVDSYTTARSKNLKSAVVTSMVKELFQRGLRFIKRDPKADGRWYVLSPALAHEKTGHAIRDHWMQKKRQAALAEVEVQPGKYTAIKTLSPPSPTCPSSDKKKTVNKGRNSQSCKYQTKKVAPATKKFRPSIPRQITTEDHKLVNDNGAEHHESQSFDQMPELESMSLVDLDIVSMSSITSSTDHQLEDYEWYANASKEPILAQHYDPPCFPRSVDVKMSPSAFDSISIPDWQNQHHLHGQYHYLPSNTFYFPRQQDRISPLSMTIPVFPDSRIMTHSVIDYDFNCSNDESFQVRPSSLNMEAVGTTDHSSTIFPLPTSIPQPNSCYIFNGIHGGEDNRVISLPLDVASTLQHNVVDSTVSSSDNQIKMCDECFSAVHTREIAIGEGVLPFRSHMDDWF